ncbi:hypothetical protein SCE1572_13405 [Sorangium cellulosum So0157-2]|uniref:Uncharacterized protein n=1 Tax=Sorangium cellulosum So0157-2 TaxID=1254432 RepID=S4XXU4_SORCE|nr:hypothetical protein SCE1572_13405 [Sorangium cellulosum So0157-2]
MPALDQRAASLRSMLGSGWFQGEPLQKDAPRIREDEALHHASSARIAPSEAMKYRPLEKAPIGTNPSRGRTPPSISSAGPTRALSA